MSDPPAHTTGDGVRRVKTIKTQAFALPTSLPMGIFDPKWNEPAVATRVAHLVGTRAPKGDAPLVDDPLPLPKDVVEERVFLLAPTELRRDGHLFRGGSYGELHRHLAFGTTTANFHAQSVCFGLDERGRYFLHATVGRFDGPWGNDGILDVTFFAGGERLGACRWHGRLDPATDRVVALGGTDARLAGDPSRVDRAVVRFAARHGSQVPGGLVEEKAAPRISKARRAVLLPKLRAALQAQGAERVAAIKSILDGLAVADVESMLREALPPARAHELDTLAATVQPWSPP